VLCAVCCVQCAVCCVQCAVCSVLCALCSVLCAVCSVQCAVCCVQCAVCSVPSIFITGLMKDITNSGHFHRIAEIQVRRRRSWTDVRLTWCDAGLSWLRALFKCSFYSYGNELSRQTEGWLKEKWNCRHCRRSKCLPISELREMISVTWLAITEVLALMPVTFREPILLPQWHKQSPFCYYYVTWTGDRHGRIGESTVEIR